MSRPRPDLTTGPNLAVQFGWVSLFQDLASKMVVPLVPLFLALSLEASPLVIGLIDGIAASTVVAVAPATARFGARMRAITMTRFGYGLSSLAKPALALATGWVSVLLIRVVDRAGKGIRDAPRDELLARSGSKARQGTRFGVQQAMDKFGGFLGPLAGLALYSLLDGSFRAVFAIAALPAAMSMIYLARIDAPEPQPEDQTELDDVLSTKRFATTRAQRQLLAALAVAAVGAVPVSLILVRGLRLDLGVTSLLGAFALHRLANAVVAIPAGRLIDSRGPAVGVRLGLGVACGALLVAATAAAPGVWLALALLGVSDALVRSGTKVWLGQLGRPETHRVAFGDLTAASAVGALVAGGFYGAIWQDTGEMAMIVGAAVTACAGLIAWPLASPDPART